MEYHGKGSGRKAQLMIMVILISFVVVGFIFYMTEIREGSSGFGRQVASAEGSAQLETKVSDYVRSCLALVSVPVIEELTWNGGTLKPQGRLFVQRKPINSLCREDIGQCRNVLLTRAQIEQELEGEILSRLDSCLDLGVIRQEVDALEAGPRRVKVTMNRDDLQVTLEMPLSMRKGQAQTDMKEFTARIDSPLSRLFEVSQHLLNIELSGDQTDKEEVMLLLGSEYWIEKHRPYPDAVFSITKYDRVRQRNVSFHFGIEGVSTVGTDVFHGYGNAMGCCQFPDGMCAKGADGLSCSQKGGVYRSDPSCECEAPAYEKVGCCVNALDHCSVVPQRECPQSSVFYANDPWCTKSRCANFDCVRTFDYTTGSLTRSARRHAESWCVYEDRPGYARDFVGSRHYKHSCMFGKEMVEECRDYREELCTQEQFIVGDRLVDHGDCRVNRWQDCYAQKDQSSCEDVTQRDCYWFGGDKLYIDEEKQSMCVPFVPPGFRFWEGNGLGVCQLGSREQNDIAEDWPRTWSFSTFLVCQRLGDCGDKRNVMGEISVGGYRNKWGTPDRGDQRLFFSESFINDGQSFIVSRGANRVWQNPSVTVPSGGSADAFAKCGLWVPSTSSSCALCDDNPFRPCSEYRCKSLSGSCSFSMVQGVGYCGGTPLPQVGNGNIRFSGLDAWLGIPNSVWGSGAEHRILRSEARPFLPVHVEFETDVPSRCALAVLDYSLLGSHDQEATQWINPSEYRSAYSFDIRLPARSSSFEFVHNNRVVVLIQCYDERGLRIGKDIIMEFPIADTEESAPEVISHVVTARTPTDAGTVVQARLFIDRPFDACFYGFGQDGSDRRLISCAAKEEDMDFDLSAPHVGYFVCDASMLLNGQQSVYVSCVKSSLQGQIRHIQVS